MLPSSEIPPNRPRVWVKATISAPNARGGGALHTGAPGGERDRRAGADLELVVQHRVQSLLGQDHHHALRVLDAGLQAKAAAAHAVERRIGPRAVGGARQHHAAAALGAEDEAGFEHARADHDGARLAQQIFRVFVGLAHQVLQRERGAIDARLLVGSAPGRPAAAEPEQRRAAGGSWRSLSVSGSRDHFRRVSPDSRRLSALSISRARPAAWQGGRSPPVGQPERCCRNDMGTMTRRGHQ